MEAVRVRVPSVPPRARFIAQIAQMDVMLYAEGTRDERSFFSVTHSVPLGTARRPSAPVSQHPDAKAGA